MNAEALPNRYETVTTVPRELVHFALLDRSQQEQAIRRMAFQGWSDHTIASATRLSVETIRRTLAEHQTSTVAAHE